MFTDFCACIVTECETEDCCNEGLRDHYCCNEGLHDHYCCTEITGVVKRRRIRWAVGGWENVAYMVEKYTERFGGET